MVDRSVSRTALIWAGLGGLAVGVLASFAGGYVWAERNAESLRRQVETSRPARVATSVPERRIVIDRGTSPVDEKRLAAIEQQLAALAPPAVSGSARDPEAIQVESQRRHEARVQEHAAEPVDPVWSRSTASLIEADVLKQAAGKMNVRLGRVDCRTTSCTADLEWPSSADADREYISLVHFPYRANCGRTLVLPAPSTAPGPLRAQLLLDCESWRADGAEPLEANPTP